MSFLLFVAARNRRDEEEKDDGNEVKFHCLRKGCARTAPVAPLASRDSHKSRVKGFGQGPNNQYTTMGTYEDIAGPCTIGCRCYFRCTFCRRSAAADCRTVAIAFACRPIHIVWSKKTKLSTPPTPHHDSLHKTNLKCKMNLYFTLPKHETSLQFCEFEFEPEHWLPPPAGDGLSHDRVRVLVPLLHDCVHADHGNQLLHPPSTAITVQRKKRSDSS